MLAKCINTASPVILEAKNIDELSNIDLIDKLSCYLPFYYDSSTKITFRQISFDSHCRVLIGSREFIFKFIDITKLTFKK
jgi:hypothetical protein